jgi:23S rRNA (cytidine1920-2'-O)/16S rRNA (cytidine1409-2'-O)-methyltransferase
VGRKARLDKLLVDRGLAPSRHRARELIEGGDVLVDGVPAIRPAAQVDLERQVRLREAGPDWVGRGAEKLFGVLGPFGVDPEGRVCADLGASTGGFTEVLIRAGASRVYAIDVGRGQLHQRLVGDPRVVVMDGVNARHLEALAEPVDLVVGDLSFISLTLILPAIRRILRPDGEAVLLIKPQFEVGRERVASGGRVRTDADRAEAIARVANDAERAGFSVLGSIDSPIAGAKSGNIEHFLHLGGPDDAVIE